MKKKLPFTFGAVFLIAAAAFASAALASAALASTDDPTDPSSNNLVNLINYAHLGQFYFSPSFNSTVHAENGPNATSQTEVQLDLSYGVLVDGLRVFIIQDDFVRNYSGNAQTLSYSGLANPTLGAAYRIVDLNPAGFSLDVEYEIAPSLGTYTLAAPGLPGSVANGGPTSSLYAFLYWNRSISEARLGGELFRSFAGNQTNQSNSDFSASRGSYWMGDFSVIERLHVTPRFYVEAQGTAYLPYTVQYGYANTTTGSNSTPFHVEPLFEVGYLQSKNVLIDAYISYEKYTVSYNDSTSFQSQTLNYSTTLGMTMKFEF